jgi:hypothetical protein
MFLTLAAEGSDSAANQRSITRTGFVLFLSLLVLLAMPLYWTAGAQGASEQPQAVAVKSDDDDDGEDDDGADDTTGGGTTGTGGNDTGTGVETKAQVTDRGAAALKTGVSTRGETDPGDDTGKTERR